MAKEREDNHKKEGLLQKTARLTVTGAEMSAVNVIIGHPLDTIKTYAQRHNQGFYEAAKNVCGKNSYYNGVNCLYRGLVPNLTRNIVNTTWRVPLTTLGPKAFADTFSMHDKKGNPSQTANVAASFLFTGPIDVALSSVFEVAKITKQTGGTYGGLYQNFKEKGGGPKAFSSTFLRGGVPAFFKVGTGYSTLFVIKKLDKDFNDKFNHDGNSSYWTTPVSAAFAATTKVAITNPLDVIKTHKQSVGGDDGRSMLSTSAKIFQEKGVKAFYRGMSPRLLHGFMAANSGLIIMKLSEDGESKHKNSYAQNIIEERKKSEQSEKTIS